MVTLAWGGCMGWRVGCWPTSSVVGGDAGGCSCACVAATRDPNEPTPETVLVRREQDGEVVAALSRLRPQDQELFLLALWEQVPHAQIAEMLGCSTQAITQRIYRATRRAAKEYERLEHGHTVTGATAATRR